MPPTATVIPHTPSQPPLDPPAHHTRSQGRPSAGASSAAPAQLSPTKKRRRKGALIIPDQTDLEVWDKADAEIIAAHRAQWRSEYYNHYTITLERRFTTSDPPHPDSLWFIFTCKYSKEHGPQSRRRLDTKEGTGNLAKRIKVCDQHRGANSLNPDGTDKTLPVRYNEHRHRALLVLRCARRHRPFNMVEDPEYKMEIEMLRPGTVPPSRHILALDNIFCHDLD